MNAVIQKRSDFLVENWKLIRKDFLGEDSLFVTIAAASYADKERSADVEYLKDCKELLKDRSGFFSGLRGNSEFILATRMALNGNPEKYLDDVKEVYEKFQKGKFFDSAYRVLAAMTICDANRQADADAIIEKTDALLKSMNREHPFLTSDEDTGLVVLLALTNKSTEDILAELEESYKQLKKGLSFHDNAVYSLAQVLTSYEGNVEEKSEKALELFNEFKKQGAKYGKEYELASIGVLLNLDISKEALISEIIEVSDYLKENKGFGTFSMSESIRLMFATTLVSGAYSSDTQAGKAASATGAIGRVVAEQTASFIAIMAATSSVVNSSSSN
jgi:hypothetical protein